jgi:hypothetical protein
MAEAGTPAGRLTRRSLLGLSLGVVAVGCGLIGDEPVEPLPPEQIVLGVSGGLNGWSPSILRALQSPSLLVYGDGRVLALQQSVTVRNAIPGAYVEAQVAPSSVARLVADAERRGLLRADLGDPTVTDQGSTRIWLHGRDGEQQVLAYAFEKTFDQYVGLLQRRNRARVRQLIDDGVALLGDGALPYVPDRVVVLELRHEPADDEEADAPWPGPDPASFLHTPKARARGAIACGELTGTTAAEVYAAARVNPQQRWLVAGRTRVLAVNPLPVELDC